MGDYEVYGDMKIQDDFAKSFVANQISLTPTTPCHRFEANMTPLPFDKQLRRDDTYERTRPREEQLKKSKQEAVDRSAMTMGEIANSQEFTPAAQTMSQWSESARQVKTPLDELRERLYGGGQH